MQLLQSWGEGGGGAMKTGQNEQSHIFQEIGIPEINVRPFEHV